MTATGDARARHHGPLAAAVVKRRRKAGGSATFLETAEAGLHLDGGLFFGGKIPGPPRTLFFCVGPLFFGTITPIAGVFGAVGVKAERSALIRSAVLPISPSECDTDV